VGVRVQYRNKSSILAMCGKIVAATEKCTSESIKCEGVVDRFFFSMGRLSFVMNLFHVVRQSMDAFTWSSWGRQSDGRGLRGGETRPGFCTTTTHLRTRCSSSVNFWRSTRRLSSLSFVPEIEIHAERSPISDDKRDRRNSLRGLRATPQNASQDAFQNWKKRWKRCIGWKYFEGDKSY
jgi:hypothetical protein